jgi:hypothetical protein
MVAKRKTMITQPETGIYYHIDFKSPNGCKSYKLTIRLTTVERPGVELMY